MTSRRFLALTGAAIIILLGIWFVRAAANERGVLCVDDSARSAWLADYGVEAELTPVWVRTTTVGSGSGWEEYAAVLKQNGFDISALSGERVTVYCYEGCGQNEGSYIRVVSLHNRAVGYDISRPIAISQNDIH